MDISKLRQKVSVIRVERKKLEDKLLSFRGEMLPYYLKEYYFPCGKVNCKCKKGKLHGPFLYIVGKEGDKRIFQYVKKKDIYTIEKTAGSYKRYQKTLSEIRKINKTISDSFNQIRKELIVKK